MFQLHSYTLLQLMTTMLHSVPTTGCTYTLGLRTQEAWLNCNATVADRAEGHVYYCWKHPSEHCNFAYYSNILAYGLCPGIAV